MKRRRDYYQVLGIPPDADEREIRSAYRGLAKKFHPDTGEGSSEEKFRDVQDAYEVLGDPESRRRYDQSQNQPLRAPGARQAGFASGPRSAHVDLRYVNRSQPPEPLEFARRDPFRQAWPDDELWELLRFLLTR